MTFEKIFNFEVVCSSQTLRHPKTPSLGHKRIQALAGHFRAIPPTFVGFIPLLLKDVGDTSLTKKL